MRTGLFTAIALTLTTSAIAADANAADATSRCAQLTEFKHRETTISSSEPVPANRPMEIRGYAGLRVVNDLPAHCVVRGEVGRHTGKDGVSYASKFELRLPDEWNGRFLFQGGGGLDGIVAPALAFQGPPSSARPSALAQGFAVVSTDGGHEQKRMAPDGSFGRDPEALADYQYQSTREVTDAAKLLVQQYYEKAPSRSYFQGCSNGGREGLVAAQRYPAYFDGVIAGAPAFNLTKAMTAQAWNTVTYATIAPKDESGRPSLAKALSNEDMKLLADSILAQCDVRDGLKDDLVNASCDFDPGSLVCSTTKAEACLGEEKVSAIRKAFGGPKTSKGAPIYSDFPFDPGIGDAGWRMWILGTEQMPAINVMIFPPAINGVALAGEAPPIDIFQFNFDSDPERLDRTSKQLDATSTDYKAFKQHNGKLLLYSGMSDPVFSANDLIRYYKQLVDANGGPAAASKFARLFLAPGMTHCGGGPALDDFDTLGTLVAWVEKGEPPERILARGAAFPNRTRPMCPYPKWPRHVGSGSTEDAQNFECRAP